MSPSPAIDPNLNHQEHTVKEVTYPYLGEISNTILAAVTGPTTSAEVSAETGLPRKQIADYLARHARAGLIRRVHRGVYAPAAPTN